MKVALVTIRVPHDRNYDGVAQRWQDTYLKFRPQMPHDLVVVDSDREGPPPEALMSYVTKRLVYTGGGWDCGTWIFVGRELDADLLVCCNTSTYYERTGWLERLVAAAGKHGKGLYGPMCSLAHHPHVRTPCMAFQPEVIRDYPHVINSRPLTYRFECLGGHDNFTLWCKGRGYAVKQVTWDGEQDISDWRKPPNVFWKGDQSNLLVKDRHANRYDTGTPESRRQLNKEANGQ